HCGPRYRGSTRSIHIAGVCVTSRNVAKSSSAFRIPNTEVKDPHCWSMRYKLQCGERLPFATKYLFGVGGSAILSTGDYRAFRSRADDTWGASPWQSRSSPGNKQNAISHEVAFLCFNHRLTLGPTLQEYALRDAMWR
ncbi:MAG: hypothetical protein P4L69_14010, partial [Desulfosporosinus sp.]|nr:hypothetical protein [Desulfosporosinus sp.]